MVNSLTMHPMFCVVQFKHCSRAVFRGGAVVPPGFTTDTEPINYTMQCKMIPGSDILSMTSAKIFATWWVEWMGGCLVGAEWMGGCLVGVEWMLWKGRGGIDFGGGVEWILGLHCTAIFSLISQPG